MSATEHQPTWQFLMICWGDRYGAAYINHTVEAVLRHASSKPRVVLISDRPRPGLHPDVQVVDFDPYYLQPQFMKGALIAKLVMFEKGVVPDDLPTVFLDLDTAVFGDLEKAIKLMRHRKHMMMIQSVVLPFGWPGRLVYRLTNKKKYARGNSSMVVYHPAECSYIAETWRKLWDEHGGFGIRPMIGDERFISWVAQENMDRIPNWLAVKFLNEYMHSAKWLVYLKGALPWIKRRRDNLVAVTLPGPVIKPEALMTYSDGDEIFEEKNRWLLWNERALGSMGQRLHDYYRPLIEALEAEGRAAPPQ